jgi:hypothetical protein
MSKLDIFLMGLACGLIYYFSILYFTVDTNSKSFKAGYANGTEYGFNEGMDFKTTELVSYINRYPCNSSFELVDKFGISATVYTEECLNLTGGILLGNISVSQSNYWRIVE